MIKRIILAIATAASISAASAVIVPTEANACNVQIGRPGSCDAAYRRDWAAGRYGHGGPWDPNGGARGGFHRGGVSYGGHAHGGGYRYGGVVPTGRSVFIGRTFVRRHYVSGGAATVVAAPPVVVRERTVVREAAPVVVQRQAVVERRVSVRKHYGHRVAAKPACDTCKRGGTVTVGNITATASAPNATATNVVSINNVTLSGGGAVPASAAARNAPSSSTVVGWASHGKNPQCEGKPKFVEFTCTSPATGRETKCMCD